MDVSRVREIRTTHEKVGVARQGGKGPLPHLGASAPGGYDPHLNKGLLSIANNTRTCRRQHNWFLFFLFFGMGEERRKIR